MTAESAKIGPVVGGWRKVVDHARWSFVGVVLGGIGVWVTLFYARGPDLMFAEIANAPVFEVRDPLEELEVRYRGTDLRRGGKSLTLIQLATINVGSDTIRIDSYDQRGLPGVAVGDALIVRAEVVGASSEYLRRNLRLNVVAQEVRFQPVIIEPSEEFELRLLVINREGVSPNLRAVGKLAGIRTIKIGSAQDLQLSRSRAMRYFVWLMMGLIALMVLGLMGMVVWMREMLWWILSEPFQRRRKRKEAKTWVEQFKENEPGAAKVLTPVLSFPLEDEETARFVSRALDRVPRLIRGRDVREAIFSEWRPADWQLEMLANLGIPVSDKVEGNPQRLLEVASALRCFAVGGPAPLSRSLMDAAEALTARFAGESMGPTEATGDRRSGG